VRAFEREYLTRVLRDTSEGGGVKKADIARALGISRKTLWEKLKGYGIGSPDDAELT